MKKVTYSIQIIFLLCFFYSYAEGNIIKLKLTEGENYVFEFKTTYSEFDAHGQQFVESITEQKVRFTIEEVNNEKVIFSSVIVSEKSENPDADIKTIHNIQFPPQYDNIDIIASQFNIVKSLLSVVELEFEIDLKNNTIKQINATEKLDEMVSILEEKGYRNTSNFRVKEFIQKNDEIFRQIMSYNYFLLYVNHAVKIDNEELKSKYFNKRFSKNQNGQYISGKNEQLAGNQFMKLSVDEKHGFVSGFYEARYDSIDPRFTKFNRTLRLTETKINYIEKYKEGNELFTFNCTVQNPVDSVITLFYLDKPYGEVHTRRYLKLDENNTASTQIFLPAQSFIFISLEEMKYNHNFAGYILYAEPRDTLTVNVLNKNNTISLDISGSNEIINNVFYGLEKDKKLFSSIRKTLKTAHSTTDFTVFGFAEEAVKIFDNYLQDKNIRLHDDTYRFIANELKAMQFINYFSFLNQSRFIQIRLEGLKSNDEPEVNENNTRLHKSRQMIQDFDIHDIYNDYGIFSRGLSNSYFYYYLNNLARVKSMGYNQRITISDEFEAGRMILGGAIYYRVMADRIIGSMMKNTVVFTPHARFELQEAVSLLNNLMKYSYDENFNSSLEEYISSRMNWEEESFIPESHFVRPDGEKIQLKNLIQDKPVVIHVSNNWSRFRYNFDRLAEENPEIRFIMIVEGNKLKEWQDYLQRAEPVAEQLLLINDELTLEDIFSRSDELYIAYDKDGNLLGYDISGKQAINRAKDSLSGRKELDKSQLQFIVLLLSIAFIALATAFFIWKWQSRQRIRKEQQQRRLRELELTAIRSQMNPHFLFNCLNSVQNLVQQNKGREAHLYLADFAGLIRNVLNNSEKEEVSLAEELEMVQQYLSLEKLRFDFDYQINVDEGVDIHNTLVPSMLVQPFAENAVIHGLQSKAGEKQLKIDVKKNSEEEGSSKGIVITIQDNGVGRQDAQKLTAGSNGRGTKLVQERLAILQQQQQEKYWLQTTDLKENGSTGTKVEIFVPEEN